MGFFGSKPTPKQVQQQKVRQNVANRKMENAMKAAEIKDKKKK